LARTRQRSGQQPSLFWCRW